MAQSLCQDLDQKLRMDRGDYGQETFSAGADHQLNELHENYGCISVTLSKHFGHLWITAVCYWEVALNWPTEHSRDR